MYFFHSAASKQEFHLLFCIIINTKSEFHTNDSHIHQLFPFILVRVCSSVYSCSILSKKPLLPPPPPPPQPTLVSIRRLVIIITCQFDPIFGCSKRILMLHLQLIFHKGRKKLHKVTKQNKKNGHSCSAFNNLKTCVITLPAHSYLLGNLIS